MGVAWQNGLNVLHRDEFDLVGQQPKSGVI
jgi:hypothetical protein